MHPIDVVVVSYGTQKQVERMAVDMKTMVECPYTLHVFNNDGNPKTLSVAWNDLARLGTAQYLAFLNPDIAISPGWGRKMISLLSDHPEIGAVIPTPFTAARPLKPFREVTIDGKWGNPPTASDMAEIAGKFSGFEGYQVHHFPCGFYAVVMRRSTWAALFGFDERLTFYGGDHDFQERMKPMGLATVQIKSVPFWSDGGLSTRIAISRKEFDFRKECQRTEEVLAGLRKGTMVRWHALSSADREAVRKDPKYNRIAR